MVRVKYIILVPVLLTFVNSNRLLIEYIMYPFMSHSLENDNFLSTMIKMYNVLHQNGGFDANISLSQDYLTARLQRLNLKTRLSCGKTIEIKQVFNTGSIKYYCKGFRWCDYCCHNAQR